MGFKGAKAYALDFYDRTQLDIGSFEGRFGEAGSQLDRLYQRMVNLEAAEHQRMTGFNRDIKEFDNIYGKQLAAGKSINESIKKMQETKSKEAGNILFQDILRVLENKRNNNTQITDFFGVR